MTLQQSALVAFNDLSSAAGKLRALSEGLRAFLTAYNSASDEERLRIVEGHGKGAGLALLAVPMADAFIFSQAQFQRILSNYLGLEGAISIHTRKKGHARSRGYFTYFFFLFIFPRWGEPLPGFPGLLALRCGSGCFYKGSGLMRPRELGDQVFGHFERTSTPLKKAQDKSHAIAKEKLC